MGEKKRLAGQVDRIEGDTIVVVVKDPSDGEIKEIYVKKKLLKKVSLKEGDDVTVEINEMAMEANAEIVSIAFSGVKPVEMAKRFFSYLVDGGLEDQLIQELSGNGLTLEISGSNKKKLTVSFEVAKEKAAKKTVRKPVKKAVKKSVKAKAPVKKSSAKQPKKR
ncbi:MAG: hypothetical protein ACD_25C00261G0003 [uncultured bacterium]|nr:MAG: hypothetical protein ACD_25C00261G0003 [uncultured bacterium]